MNQLKCGKSTILHKSNIDSETETLNTEESLC